MIVRRVKRLNPPAGKGKTKGAQDELFAADRHHAVFTDSPPCSRLKLLTVIT